MAAPSLGNIWQLQRHLPALVPLISRCERTRSDIDTIFRRLKIGAERGLIPDFVDTAGTVNVKPGALEESHKQVTDEENPDRAEKKIRRNDDYEGKHFDDRFVVKIIGRAIWIFENVAEQCIDCWSQLEQIEIDNPLFSSEQLKRIKNKKISEYGWNTHSIRTISILCQAEN